MEEPGPGRYLVAAVVEMGVANLVAALLVFVFQNLVTPNPGDVGLETITFVLYVAFAFPTAGALAAVILRRTLVRVRRAGEAPGRDDQVAVLMLPVRLAGLALVFWILAVGVFTGLSVAAGEPRLAIARDATATFLGGLTAALITLLLVERRLRPLVAVVLAGRQPVRARAVGMTGRLLLSWALGSGIPLLALAGSQVRAPGAPPPSTESLLFLSGLGIVIGALLVGLAARSVAEPLRQLQAALARVREGDLSVTVPVNDAGEIGQLQGVFNAMVEGLRERRRLEDIFGRHVGPEVARLALASGVRLGGETRQASVLFVDLVGSTPMIEHREPSQVLALLNDFFAAVVTSIDEAGGWVDKFMGDGALCVFGAPAHQPDHAARALGAACALHQRLRQLRSRWPGLDWGIGVSSGTVVAGNVGAEQRFEYTVVGDPVNEAARLTEEAKHHPARVLASGTAITAAGDDGRRWPLVDHRHLRGREEETAVHCPTPG